MIINPSGDIQQKVAGAEDIRNAKWTKTSDGSYTLSNDMVVGHQSSLTYDPGTDTIKDNTGLLWTRTGTGYVIATTPVPAFELISKKGTCQSTGSLYIEGTVKSNTANAYSVVMKGAAYDSNNVKLGTGIDYVDLDAHGTSAYKIIILDGCPEGGQGQFTVDIDSYR
jgi:hypothetical protein